MKIYLTSNEYLQEETIRNLQQKQFNFIPGKQRAHLGVAGTFNFNIAVGTQTEFIIMGDANPEMVKVNKETIRLLGVSQNQDDFLNALVDFCLTYIKSKDLCYGACSAQTAPSKDRKAYNTLRVSNSWVVNDQNQMVKEYNQDFRFTTIIKKAFTEPGGLFTNENAFSYLQQLAREDRIIAIDLDLTDQSQTTQVKELMIKRGLQIESIYLSNVEEWITLNAPDKISSYYDNIRILTDGHETALIVGHAEIKKEKDFLNIQQRVYFSSELPSSGI